MELLAVIHMQQFLPKALESLVHYPDFIAVWVDVAETVKGALLLFLL